jgi:hypothetical protein
MKLWELARLDLLFILISRKNLEDKAYFDKNTMARAPSYAFYETKKVLEFIRLNDYKETLCKRVLSYLYSIQDYLRLNPDPKAFVLRKSTVLLKRKQKAIDQKEYNSRFLKETPGTGEHLKTLFEFRNKKRNPSPKRGWTYWLSLGCVRSKSQTP